MVTYLGKKTAKVAQKERDEYELRSAKRENVHEGLAFARLREISDAITLESEQLSAKSTQGVN